MATKEMKTLTIGTEVYEVVDEKAREDIEYLKVNGGGGSGSGTGADGFSPTVEISKSGKVTTIDITDKNGTKTATINDGADGVSATHSWNGTILTIRSANGTSSADLKGEKGNTGDTGATGSPGASITVTSVSESNASGGSNVVTFSDGKKVTIKNGAIGAQGAKGFSIYTGTVSKEADGIMISSYDAPVNYAPLVGDMIITPDGDLYRITSMPSSTEIYVEHTGTNLKGADGHTPVKHTDYFTPADREEMIEEIIVQMGGQPVFGMVDSGKNIVLTAPLADGDYVLKYENADGTFTDISTITVSGGTASGGGSVEPAYVNLIPTAKTHTALNTVFNEIGYRNGTYASSSSPFYGTDANTVCTGCMPASVDSVFYIKGATLNSNSHVRFGFGKDNGNGIISNHCVKMISELTSYITVDTLADNYYKVTFNKDYFTTTYPAIEYMYFSAVGTGDNLIVATTPIQ